MRILKKKRKKVILDEIQGIFRIKKKKIIGTKERNKHKQYIQGGVGNIWKGSIKNVVGKVTGRKMSQNNHNNKNKNKKKKKKSEHVTPIRSSNIRGNGSYQLIIIEIARLKKIKL